MNCDAVEVCLSGYLDKELTQQESQKVEVHLSTCPQCRRLFEKLQAARRTTQQLAIEAPSRREWKNMESAIMERLSRGAGWIIVIVWTTITLAYTLFQFATSPHEPLFEKILVFGFFLGIALLFFSVLMERLRESRTDRYKGVLK